MSKGKQAVKSVIAILSFTLLSKFMGFFRELAIAAKFGLGTDTDTFFIATSAITMIGNVVVVSLNTTFIPILVEVETKEGKEGKNLHASNALNISLIVATILLIIVEVGAPILSKIIAPGFAGRQMELLIWYIRVGMPLIFISATMGITRGYLQSEMKFFETSFSNVTFNLVYLTYLLLLATKFDITSLIFVHLLARGSQLLMQIKPLRQIGFKYIPILDFKDKYIQRMGVLIAPVLIGVAIQDLNFIVDKSLASSLVTGSISALNYSVRINTLIQSIFVSAIVTVLFPMMTRAFSQSDKSTQISLIKKGFVTIIMIAFPAMVAMLLLNQQIIQAAFMRGKFDQVAVTMTSDALFYYAFGVIPMALLVFLQKVFHSIQDTQTPLYTGLVTLVTNVVFSVVLMQFMSYKGLALATSISFAATIWFMIKKLSTKSLKFIDREISLVTLKVSIASLVMGCAVVGLQFTGIEARIASSILSLIIYAIVGVVVYFCVLKMLKIKELDWFIDSILSQIRKKKTKPSSSEIN